MLIDTEKLRAAISESMKERCALIDNTVKYDSTVKDDRAAIKKFEYLEELESKYTHAIRMVESLAQEYIEVEKYNAVFCL